CWTGSNFQEFYLDQRIQWTSDADMPAGSVVTITGSGASTGTLLGTWNLFGDPDLIYAFQGYTKAPRFLAALNSSYW
ncbi:MAG TPA: hypothetical protein DCR93_11810, partial [Cytophagales bacterium]|nr:hypothetical protein [Cytophagales bacterium]